MSDATYQLLTSAEFFTAVAVGAVGVVIVLAWAVFTRSPSPVGGVVLVAGIAIAIALQEEVPLGLILGLGLLILAGLATFRSPLAMMALAIPGGLVVALTSLSVPGAVVVATLGIPYSRRVVIVFVAVVIVLLAVLVESFDRRFATTTVATPLLAISVVSVFLTVPDTRIVLLGAGAALPWLVAGPPAKLARLGRSGSYAAVGMVVWLVATGGFGRPLSLFAGVATLGVLAIEPLVAALRSQGRLRQEAEGTISDTTVAVVVAAHIAIQALIAIVVRV